MGNRHSIGLKRKQKVIQGNVNVPASCTLEKTSLVVTQCNGTKYWKVRTIEVRNTETGGVLNTETELQIRDPQLQNWLSSYGVNLYYPPLTEEQEKKRKTVNKPLVAIEQLFHALPKLQMCQGVESITQLCKYVEEEKEKNLKKGLALMENGLITFDCCWDVFSVGKQVAVELSGMNGVIIGTKILSLNYSRGVVPFWQMTGKVIKSDGKEFYEQIINFSIGYFTSPTPLEDLNVQPLTTGARSRLEERGTKFREIALSHRYMQYQGFFQKASGFGVSKFKADGRVMVDVTTFNRLHPNERTFVNPNSGAQNWNNYNGVSTQCEYTLNTSLPDDQLFSTWPTLAGFSFQRKRWGELDVDGLSHIQFDEGAFEKLVMKQETKNLIRGMVRSSGPADAYFRDFISDKGGGCIFLLHGPPGTGKTLTAEAVSEFLHTPLYSVSMGELGITTQALESNLQQILEVASIWGASILLDEADIFLERRNESDIVRNAMVGIFLRLLEYHQGVLFLTTNRLKSFDPAFQSRVSIAIKYKRLDFESRKKIWSNFLESAGLPQPEPSDLDSLAQFKLNGRQIRNTLRLAAVVASEEGVDLQLRHLQEMLIISKKWFKDFSQRKQGTTDDDSARDDSREGRLLKKAIDIYDSEADDDEN